MLTVVEEENLESKYADVFEGLGEIKGVQHKIQIDPNATPERSFREWKSWESLRNVESPLLGYIVLLLPRRRITNSECAWILVTSIVPSCVNIFPCRQWKRLSIDGVKPDPKKVEDIIVMPTPVDHEDLRSSWVW